MHRSVWLIVIAACGVAACSSQPDLSAANAARSAPLQRHDVTQAFASNGKVVVAGTQSGAVLVSADQGRSWRREGVAGASLIDMAACPDGSFVGIDFYSRVWFANAAGEAWKAVKLDRPKTPLAVACDSRNGWWITGIGSLIVGSRDRGATWAVTDQGEDVQLTTVQFVDSDFGVVTGEFGAVLVTEDGGASWSKRGALPKDFYPYATLFANRDNGWSAGLAGQVLQTRDGGRTWTPQINASAAPLYRLFMHRGVPHGVGAVGTVVQLDGGTWKSVGYPDPVPVSLGAGLSLESSNSLLIGGAGGLLRALTPTAH